MEESSRLQTNLPSTETIAEAWSILRHARYLETSRLPYFRSFSRLPVEPADLIRYKRGTRRATQATWPALYYHLFRARWPETLDLFACFSLGQSIRRSQLERAVGEANVSFLASAGLVGLADDWVTPLVRVHLRGTQAFFHDAPGSGVPIERRAYLGRDSLRFFDYLQSELKGQRRRRSLDLATGCGVQAHVLAAISNEVIAADTNERALAFARANAQINSVDNIEFLHSDLTAQVTGRFDLIVSNPPFLYRPRPMPHGHDPASDGGLLGIGYARRILARLAKLLTSDGEARILVSIPRTTRGPIMEKWIKDHLLPQGLDVRLRFVEYLWSNDQNDAYRVRGVKTPALVVAEIHRSSRPRLQVTRPPVSEKLILARKIAGERTIRARRKADAVMSAFHPSRLRRVVPLTLACMARTARVPAPPHQLMIEPCTACPLDCISCARAERVTEDKFMNVNAFSRAIEAIRPWSVQFLGNGDPLCHPEIDRLCAAARKRIRQVVLHTALPGEAVLPQAERALPHLDRLYIGIDAADPETYADIRRGGDFATLLAMLCRLQRARQGNGGPSLLVTYLLQQRNYADASAFVRLAYRMGADGVLFLPLDLQSIESRERDLVGDLNTKRLVKSLTGARETAVTIGMPTNLDFLLNSPDLLRSRYDGKKPDHRGRCVRPWLYAYVTVDGDVLPCPRFAYDRKSRLGNLFRQSFPTEIWNGEGYRQLRSDLRAGRYRSTVCQGCVVPAEEGGLWARVRRRRKVPA